MRSRERWFLSAAIALLLALPVGAAAQDVSREREALRRAQAALQQTRQERDALLMEKAELESRLRDADAVARVAPALAAELQAVRREVLLQHEQATLLRAELGTLRTATARSAGEYEARIAEWQQVERQRREQTAQLQRELGERTQANQALVARLESLNGALDDTVRRNRRLHALGVEAVEALRGLTPADRLLQRERVLGWTAVRIEDEAERLLLRLDAERAPDR